MTEKELYEQYGRLMVQQEILQQNINACKLEINKFLNPPIQPPKEEISGKTSETS